MTNFPPEQNSPNFGELEGNILPGWLKVLAETEANTPEFWELWKRAREESAKGVDTF